MVKWVLGTAALVLFAWATWALVLAPDGEGVGPPDAGYRTAPRSALLTAPHISVWWDDLGNGALATGPAHNIHPTDYAGSAACLECHPTQHKAWSNHPHRWMNALAGADTVRGDFSEAARIRYRGGTATFEQRDGAYWMRLERGDVKRSYKITQTIGSRSYQYYVGRQTEGPEPADHMFYRQDHVLPFGYWLDRKEWVPVVHLGHEVSDDERPDPYKPPATGMYYAEYASSCNYCHTTFPLGDMLARRPHQLGEHAPVGLQWSVGGYLKETHPAEYESMARLVNGGAGTRTMQNPTLGWEAPKYAATLGVSCEACHLGSKEHVESGGKVKPRFFPESPHLAVEATAKPDPGRTHDNINWACGRCHTGPRPQFAAGMSTWNSVEYADAMKGSCYSKMRCIDCHDPHTAIGPKWTVPPQKTDAVCLKCHQQYTEPAPRAAHTHHPAGSEADHCMSCHMPRVNEGLSSAVRTHMIYSPTRPDMIHANQPNACNLCHTDKPIDWTLGRLKDWYKKTYDESQITANYPHRAGPVGVGWLGSPNESVRLVAGDALTRAKDRAALPQLLDALDDPYLLNRQFTGDGLEQMLGIRLSESGYRFYQTKDERRQPLAELRKKLLTR